MHRVLAGVVGAFIIIGSIIGSADAEPYAALSSGTKPCGDFVAEPENQNMYVAWAVGYITGANSKDVGSMRGVGRQWTVGSVTVWLQNYCSQHPLVDFAEAADKLRQELAQQEGLLP
jgi:hypothetical protein